VAFAKDIFAKRDKKIEGIKGDLNIVYGIYKTFPPRSYTEKGRMMK